MGDRLGLCTIKSAFYANPQLLFKISASPPTAGTAERGHVLVHVLFLHLAILQMQSYSAEGIIRKQQQIAKICSSVYMHHII